MSLAVDPKPTNDFFVAGGTLPLLSHSYVERAADKALLQGLLKGRFCYVLNSRQMGKSSLCVRTMARLEEMGVGCAFLDITKIGGRNVTPEQWYAGMAIEAGRALNLRAEFLEYWKAESHLSPMQRFFGALQDVALAKIEGKIVIFVDEIDSTRSLSFSSDEFFAGVRECFNRRVQEPAYERLTFCFLGVAVPSDLIHDARTTPFNIGERIYLKDFTYEEIQPLAQMLGPNGDQILKRVFYWSNGHPFLTQSICRALADRGATSEKEVDELIYRDLLEPKLRETNINLSDVGNRVLNGYADGDDIARFRADILSAYGKALSGKETLPDDESNRITAVLKLSGLMRSEGKTLKVRNRIYRRAFDKAWIHENMPGQELRRQKRAFYLGVVRTALAAGIVIAVIGYLALSNLHLARKNENLALASRYGAYVATMNAMPTVYAQVNLTRMKELLRLHVGDPWRGEEWFYWDRMANQAQFESPVFGDIAAIVHLSPDGKEIVIPSQGKLIFVSSADGHVLRTVGENIDDRTCAIWLRDGKRVVNFTSQGGGMVQDAQDGRVLFKVPDNFRIPFNPNRLTKHGILGFDLKADNPAVFNFDTRTITVRPDLKLVNFPTVSDDGRYLVGSVEMTSQHPMVRVMDWQTGRIIQDVWSPGLLYPVRFRFLSDGESFLVGSDLGHVARIETKTGRIMWDIKVADSTMGSLDVSRDGSLAVVGARNRLAYLFRIDSHSAKLLRTFPEANGAALMPDGKTVMTNYFNLKFFKVDSPEPIRAMPLPAGTVASIVKGLDEDVVSALVGDKALFFNLKDGKLIPRKTSQAERLDGFANSSFWYFRRTDGGTLIRDALEAKDILNLKEKGLPTMSIENLGAKRVAVCLDGRDIQFWDVVSKRLITRIKWPSTVLSMAADPVGGRLVVLDTKYRMGLIDCHTWRVNWDNSAKHDPSFSHFQGVRDVRFSRDRKLIVTASDDDTAALWSAETGVRLATFRGHAQTVKDADISPDNSRVATVSDDQTVRLWDSKTGLELTTLGSAGNGLTVCKYTKDGSSIITVGFDGILRLWPVNPR